MAKRISTDEILDSILGRKGGEVRADSPPAPPEDEDVDGLVVAAEELISAVKRGDAQAVADALRAAIELYEPLDDEPPFASTGGRR